MSVKYGNKSIKKVYMGDKEIKSAYMGDKLVYKNAPSLLYGTLDAGYYGRVECSDFITLAEISNQMETLGVPNPHWENLIFNDSTINDIPHYWHHFTFNNKNIYWYSRILRDPPLPYSPTTPLVEKYEKVKQRLKWRLNEEPENHKVFTENGNWGEHHTISIKSKQYYLRLIRLSPIMNFKKYSEIFNLICPLLKSPVLSNATEQPANWGANYERKTLCFIKENVREAWCESYRKINGPPKIENIFDNLAIYSYHGGSEGFFYEFYSSGGGGLDMPFNYYTFRPLLEQID